MSQHSNLLPQRYHHRARGISASLAGDRVGKTGDKGQLARTLPVTPRDPLRGAPAPTNAVQEELGLGGEAVVDDVVQHGDVEPAGGHVGDQQHRALALGELGDVDLAGGLVQRAVDVRAADALGCQQLGRVGREI